jgi:eukaryotic-like serine/threonine-protein kinase
MLIKAEIEYEKKKQIGIGQGMNSSVFLAHDPQLSGDIAVKEIPKANFLNTNYFEEAQAMFASSHQSIVPVQFACQTATHVALAMPFFAKGSLTSRIEVDPLPCSVALKIAQEVLSGIAKIHQLGYIHFDVKPSNVLFNDNDVAMVSDFGQSRKILANGTVQVPPLYLFSMPPEAILSGVATVNADIFHVGLLLYRCVNGDVEFKQQRAATSISELKLRIAKGKFPDQQAFFRTYLGASAPSFANR